jgi:uncharacterized protein YbjQ (UPF0145 family)
LPVPEGSNCNFYNAVFASGTGQNASVVLAGTLAELGRQAEAMGANNVFGMQMTVTPLPGNQILIVLLGTPVKLLGTFGLRL